MATALELCTPGPNPPRGAKGVGAARAPGGPRRAMARSPLDQIVRVPQDPHRWDRAPSMHDLKPPDIAKTLLSFASVRTVSPPPGIVERMCERALKIVDTFQPVDIAALFRAMATLKYLPDPRLLVALTERATVCAKAFKPGDVADLFWSFPTLGLKIDRTLFAALSNKIGLTLHHYAGKTAVNTLWAVARMQLRREIGLIHGLVQQIQDKPELLTPMDVGMAMWSFAALGIQDLTAGITQELVEASCEDRRINDFGPMDLCSLMRSMVLCGYTPTKDQFQTLYRRTLLLMGVFEGSAVAMFLWSVAMLDGTLDYKMREEFKLKLHNAPAFSFYECGDVLWACSFLEIQLDPHVWNNIWKRALAGVADCDSTSLSNIMFAHASFRTKPEQALLDVIKERITEIIPEFEPDELANLTWAMGVLGCESPEALTNAQQNNSVAATKHPCYRIQTKEVSQRLCLCCRACCAQSAKVAKVEYVSRAVRCVRCTVSKANRTLRQHARVSSGALVSVLFIWCYARTHI